MSGGKGVRSQGPGARGQGPGARSQESGVRGRFRATSRDQTWSRNVANSPALLSTQYSVLSTWFGYRQAATILLLFLFASSFHSASTLAAETEPFATRLTALAAKCDELKLKEQTEITRTWIIPRFRGRQYLFLPTVNDPTVPKAGAAEAARQWHRKFLELRREHAEELFQEVNKASEAKEPAKAYQLLYEVLREDPDHAEARRILGYVKTGSEWKLPGAEKATPRQPPFNHPKTGWRSRGWWSLETTHFQIASNDLRELKEASQQLEKLEALWRQVFFRYWSSAEALAARIAGQDEPRAPERPKMQVILFRSRAEYAVYVANSHAKAANTLGIYDDKQHVTYFFGGDHSVYPTWYHEATHQLFKEAIPGTRDQPGQERDFWALEAAALYMESLTERAGYWTVGGCDADRLQLARYRVRSGDLSLPLASLAAMTRDEIQSSAEIGRIYTQAAGFGQFFLDYDDGTNRNGKYRAAFIDFLAAIYRGADTSQLLATSTGQPLAALDEQYREFLNVSDEDLAAIPEPARLRNLSLCKTGVTDAGLARFAGSKNLQWLDLSFTGTTDEGLQTFAANTNLKQLFLEGTRITSASLPLIGYFQQIEQLDLSRLPIRDGDLAALAGLRNLNTLFLIGCPISDDGLAAIAKLRSLKTLSLTGCPITDRGLTHLRGLDFLEHLDASGTKVTASGLKDLGFTSEGVRILRPTKGDKSEVMRKR